VTHRTRTKRSFLGTGLLLALVSASIARAEAPAAEDLTDEHVRKAIAAMVDALYAHKDAKHFWDPPTWDPQTHGSRTQAGGYTALAVLALLSAGESYQNPRLRDAIEHLVQLELGGTYAVAVRAQVWAKLPPRFDERLAHDTQWLLDGFSPKAAGWTYDQKPTTTRKDNSIRQYGALALWEAAKRGLDVDVKYWRQLERAYIDGQRPDGGWNYKGNDDPPTGSMTAAGLATLYITQDLLHASEAVRTNAAPQPYGEAIDRGLAWMNEHFSSTENPGSFRDFYYYLYGVERVGLASGRKTFARLDWYRTGTAELLARLCAWDEATRTMTVHERVGGSGNAAIIRTHHLAFGLMFLSRGRVPVVINKLETPALRWNNRPRDVANLTHWIARSSETDLSWQIVSVDDPPETWLDAPLLYLASDQAVPWTSDADPPAAALQAYLELGGTLFAVSEGRGKAFASSIETLGRALFPAATWRVVDHDDWAYTLHMRVGDRRPPLRALSNGVRDLVILCPGPDLAASFQQNDVDRPGVFTTAGNLYYYASEMNRPRPRLDAQPEAFPILATDAEVTVLRVQHDGNWNPEPRAIGRFGQRLARSARIGVRERVVPLRELGDAPPALAIATGTAAHELTPVELESIRRFVSGGGTLLFETAGGRGDFAGAAEQACATLFAQRAMPLVRHPIVTGAGARPEHDLSTVEYRPYSFEIFGARERSARLRGIEIDGRVAVLFSREDLSHALLDRSCWGVHGYAPDSAQKLLENVLRYAGGGGAS
jgi:hypothetical protein